VDSHREFTVRRWIVLVVLLLVAGAVLGRVMWQTVRGAEVSLAAVSRGRVVAAVYATGRVDTDRRATVRARLTSPLSEMLVGPGQSVVAGEVVARQDVASVALGVARAQGELESARAALAEASDAAVRAGQLVREQLLSEDAWVRARERSRELGAQVATRESALALAREQAAWAELRAPQGGVVSALAHRAGDALREGDDVLTIVDLQPAYVRVAVDERDVGRIVLGQDVRLVFDAYPERRLDGKVWRILPTVDRLTKSADVLVQLPAERPPLQLDLTATVNIITGVIADAVVVPREALSGAGTQRQVLLVDGSSRAIARPVKVGVCDPKLCEVLEGLAQGERVISPVPATLKPGARVRAE
jgi:HlyD family secretion protein